MQAGGNKQLVEQAIDKEADVARLLNEASKRTDGALDGRPNVAEAPAENPRDENHDEEREAHAREHGERDGELLVLEAG